MGTVLNFFKQAGLRTVLLVFMALSSGAAFAEVTASLWQTQKSAHFIIYYQQTGGDLVNKLVDSAENYYNSIVDELGFRRFDFWSWDNRAKIYIYKNADDFRKDNQRASWAGAEVSVGKRTIKAYIGQAGFFDSVLPHEMAHIIFREFIGLKVSLPLWIDEGVASSQEKSCLSARLKIAKNLVLQDKYIRLNKLAEIYKISDVSPNDFYSQSASLISFLLRQYGQDSFLDFSRKLRDGVEWKQALFSVYRFNSFDELEHDWKGFVIR